MHGSRLVLARHVACFRVSTLAEVTMRDPICQVGAVLAVLLGGAGCSSGSTVPEKSDAGDASRNETHDARVARDASPRQLRWSRVRRREHLRRVSAHDASSRAAARRWTLPRGCGGQGRWRRVRRDHDLRLPRPSGGMRGVPTCGCSQALCATAESNSCESATESMVSCFFYSDAGGRPFLVSGEARVAPTSASTTWGKGELPNVSGLTAAARQQLGAAWTRVAQMEHASVAAFARFALELMALGAPAELLRSTQGAMADEIIATPSARSLWRAPITARPIGAACWTWAARCPSHPGECARHARAGRVHRGDACRCRSGRGPGARHRPCGEGDAGHHRSRRDGACGAGLPGGAMDCRATGTLLGISKRVCKRASTSDARRRSRSRAPSMRSWRSTDGHPARGRELQEAALSRIVAPQIALLARVTAGAKNGRVGALSASVQG